MKIIKKKGVSSTCFYPSEAIKARIELGKFKKPKAMSFGHAHNLNEYKRMGMLDKEYRFVLIDYRNGNEQIKSKMMSHKEAAEKNKALEGTGIAWAKSY